MKTPHDKSIEEVTKLVIYWLKKRDYNKAKDTWQNVLGHLQAQQYFYVRAKEKK